MNKNIAIEFQNVGKQYRLGLVGTGSLQHDINRWWQTTVLRREDPYLKIGEVNDRSTKGHSDYVWALKDISFKVEQGDVVGIIGKNGAGKSTLLKLLSHITAPTTGDIWYRGRIASLLEVGTGFHPEMTARQNIYMNGSIMGMTKAEITRKLDEIVDFAGIERYLDTPVKRFSSGMTVRLGFAVAAFLEPEILVVDEVLAVGDAEFQKKAIGKMKDVSSTGGRTVLFVSHNMVAVRNLCKHCVFIENGMIKEIGDVEPIIDRYINDYKDEQLNIFLKGLCEHKNSGEGIYITDFRLLNNRPKTNDCVVWEVCIQNESGKNKEVEIAVNFKGQNNAKLFEFNSKDNGKVIILKPGFQKIKISKKDFPLLEGIYTMSLWIGSNNNVVDWYLDCFYLKVFNNCINGIVPENRGFPVFLSCDYDY